MREVKRYPNVAVKLILKHKNTVLMLRHQNGAFDFPGGRMEWRETPEGTLARELREELLLELEIPPKFFDVWNYIARDNSRHSIFLYYIGNIAKKPTLNSTENAEILWLSKKELKDIKKISRICKENNVKLYLTLNTIVYDEELKKIERIIKEVSTLIDAIICWDFSIIKLCQKYKIPIHISTQASISNSEDTKFFKKTGAERVVFARELNLKQIKTILKNVKIESEVFIHGAMCVAISGRCFMSQFTYGKSANRGQCLQNCRREYNIKDVDREHEFKLGNNYVMSAKDLCTLPFIEKLMNFSSLKIEGRKVKILD